MISYGSMSFPPRSGGVAFYGTAEAVPFHEAELVRCALKPYSSGRRSWFAIAS